MNKDNIGSYRDSLSLRNKIARFLWRVGFLIFFRPFIGPLFRYWRNAFLRLCGAKIGRKCAVAANVKIWAPWNLELGDYVALAPGVEIYNVSMIKIGNHVTIFPGAVIIGDIKVGDYAVIGANAVVDKDVPEGAIAVGNPARSIIGR